MPDRHHHLRLRQLVVDVADDVLALLVDRAGDQEDVGVLGVAGVDHAEPLDVVERRQAGQRLDVAAVAARGVVVDDPGRLFEAGHSEASYAQQGKRPGCCRSRAPAATTQALLSAACHFSRANTLSTRITNTNTSQRDRHAQRPARRRRTGRPSPAGTRSRTSARSRSSPGPGRRIRS